MFCDLHLHEVMSALVEYVMLYILSIYYSQNLVVIYISIVHTCHLQLVMINQALSPYKNLVIDLGNIAVVPKLPVD